MRLTRATVVGIAFCFSAAIITGCGPKWPNCKTDEHCQKDTDGKEMNYVCFNQVCVECKDDSKCEAKDPMMRCNMESNRCYKLECREGKNEDCASINPNYVCKANKCVPECEADADCESGMTCNEEKKCIEKPKEEGCKSDIECGAGMECKDGECIEKKGIEISADCRPTEPGAQPGEVALLVINFDFDKSDIRADMTEKLEQNVKCLKQNGAIEITLEGHADERGTQEYNLTLGEERAKEVQSFIERLGLESGRIRIVSKGENEPLCTSSSENCWWKNRRVVFKQSISSGM